MGCVRWLTRKVARDSDNHSTLERKRLALVVMLPTAVLSGFAGLHSLTVDFVTAAFTSSVLVAAVAWLVPVVYMCATRSLPLWLFEACTVAVAGAVIVCDWSEAAEVRGHRVWTATIVIMDMLLAVGARRSVQGLCLHPVAVWLCISALEDSARLGLYDIEGWTEMSNQAREKYMCSNPPCATDPVDTVINATFFLICLYADFVATRGFCDGMRKGQQRMAQAVRVAEQVADCLVRFDLDAAQSALDAAGDGLTEELGTRLHHLLCNLAGYRPYLPQSCFAVGADEAASCGASSPGSSPRAAASDSANPPATPVSRTPVEVCASPAAEALRSLSPLSAASKVTSSQRGSSSDGVPPRTKSSDMSSVGSLPRGGSPQRLRSAHSGRALWRHSHAIQYRRITLLSSNNVGLLAAAHQEEELVEWIAQRVGGFIAAVAEQKGVVDLLSADHLNATFGAPKNLGAHRVAAVRCAVQLLVNREGQSSPQVETESPRRGLAAFPITNAVSTGLAHCGDFGTSAAQRFMVVGGVAAFAPVLERIAAGWGAAVLIDDIVHADAEMHWECRMRARLGYSKLQPRPFALWELCGERSRSSGEHEEWMYELQNTSPDRWAQYNRAVALWCEGDIAQALAALPPEGGAAPDAAEAAPPSAARELAEALSALRAALSPGDGRSPAPPPVATVPPAAGVGRGAPVLLGAVPSPRQAWWGPPRATVRRTSFRRGLTA